MDAVRGLVYIGTLCGLEAVGDKSSILSIDLWTDKLPHLHDLTHLVL